jgi:hypothetical protein
MACEAWSSVMMNIMFGRFFPVISPRLLLFGRIESAAAEPVI